jgi:hypothetical protein
MLQQRVEQLERQVQTMAARSLFADTSAAAAASAHRLHKDALHCVLAYLSLKELPSAMRSCHAWNAAVRSLPLQNLSLDMSRPAQLCELLASPSTPLVRHVVMCNVRRTCTAAKLVELLACMPRVKSLIHPACRSNELHPQLYSSQLRELNVGLKRNAADDEEIDTIVAHMENLRSASGLRSLTLTLPQFRRYRLHQRVSLASLECMKELESLTLLHGTSLLPEQMVHIRRLPSLRALSLGGWSQCQVEALLEDLPDCLPLQLHFFGGLDRYGQYFDLKDAQVLVRMVTLQRVEPRFITPEALQLIARGLPNLCTLQLRLDPRWRDATHVSDWSMVRESLAACRQLTSLTLVATPLEELAALLLALPPSLRRLDIRECAGFLQSDAFFQCVAKGGLRHLHQLHVELAFYEEDESDPALNVAWLARLRAGAPWISAWLNVI